MGSPSSIPFTNPGSMPSSIPGFGGYPSDCLVEYYDFSQGGSSVQVWNSLAGFGLECYNGNSIFADAYDGSVSSIGCTLSAATSDQMIPASVQHLLSGASGLTDVYLLRPAVLQALTARDMISDRIVNGTSTSLLTHWFTDSGKILCGARSRGLDSFQSFTSDSAVVTVGNWVLVGVNVDWAGDSMTLYINGVQNKVVTGLAFGNSVFVPESPIGRPDTFGINAGRTAGRFFDGVFLHSLLYRRCLSASEHKDIAAVAKEVLVNLGQSVSW